VKDDADNSALQSMFRNLLEERIQKNDYVETQQKTLAHLCYAVYIPSIERSPA